MLSVGRSMTFTLTPFPPLVLSSLPCSRLFPRWILRLWPALKFPAVEKWNVTSCQARHSSWVASPYLPGPRSCVTCPPPPRGQSFPLPWSKQCFPVSMDCPTRAQMPPFKTPSVVLFGMGCPRTCGASVVLVSLANGPKFSVTFGHLYRLSLIHI